MVIYKTKAYLTNNEYNDLLQISLYFIRPGMSLCLIEAIVLSCLQYNPHISYFIQINPFFSCKNGPDIHLRNILKY